MLSDNIFDQLRGRLKALKERDDRQHISNLAVASKLGLTALKFLGRRARASLVEPHQLNIAFFLQEGVGDQCQEFQWVKAFIDHLVAQELEVCSILVTDKADFVHEMTKDYPHITRLCELDDFCRHHWAHLSFYCFRCIDFQIHDEAALNKYAPQLLRDLKQAQPHVAAWRPFRTQEQYFKLMHLLELAHYNYFDLLGLNGLIPFDRHSPSFFSVDQDRVQQTRAKFGLEQPFIVVGSSVGFIPLPQEEQLTAEQKLQWRQKATRLIPVALAEEFIALLKQELPQYCLVQLGGKDAVPFAGVDLNLIAQTSFNDSIDLTYAAACQIINDSGLMHVRHAMGKSAVVLWGPTSGAIVGYDDDVNLQGSCKPCAFLTPDWNTSCPRGYACAQCMTTIQAADVVAGVKTLLARELSE